MKRIAILGILLLVFALAVASTASAGDTWYDSGDRETVEVTSGTADVDVSFSDVGWSGSDENNMTFPFKIADFNQTQSKFCVYSTGNTTNFTLLVNGVAIGADVELANDTWWNKTFADIVSAGVDENATYMLINGTFNNSEWLSEGCFVAEDAEFTEDFIDTIVYHEEDNGTAVPKIDDDWEVRDRINITTYINMTDMDIKLSYPDSLRKASTAVDWINDSTINMGVNSLYVIWDKQGPHVDIEDSDNVTTQDVSLSNQKLTIVFESNDVLEGATWDLSDGDNVYEEYLSVITDEDWHDLAITLNDEDISGSDIEVDEDDTIILSDLPEIDDDDDNEFVFEWYEEGAGTGGETTTPEEEEEPSFLYQENVEGIPNWALLSIIVVIIIAGIAVMKIEKK